jgi:RNA polymerase sigma-70 factor (ECF subfamily)
MDRNTVDRSTLKLIFDAQKGNRESLGLLTELVEGRLLAYIYRLTLDHEVAQDLSQQTLTKMVESIRGLRQPDRFWFWLFRTAMGNVQHYFRDQQREHRVRLAALDKQRWEEEMAEDRDDDGLDRASRLELAEVVIEAIMQMRLSYRNILVLRCFEQMTYADIAKLTDSKELRVRVLFYRAKHALRQQLARQGITKSVLGVGLTLFGLLTTHSKGTAVTISASTLSVGVSGTIVGAMGTRVGAILTSCLATLVVGFTFQRLVLAVVLLIVFLVFVAILNLLLE